MFLETSILSISCEVKLHFIRWNVGFDNDSYDGLVPSEGHLNIKMPSY